MRTVIVFARAPARGAVKTRLEPALGKDRTLALYRAFLADTLESAAAVGARVVLAHTPAPPFPEQDLADALVVQRGATFGDRFDLALLDAWTAGGGPLVLVGADSPHLGPHAIEAAFRALEGADAVVGPSTEGGFHLVGFREAPILLARAFEAPNDAAGVVRLARAAGLRCALTEPSFDVDLPADLVALAQRIELAEAVGGWVPPRTSTALRAWGARVERGLEGTRGLRLAIAGSP